MIRFESVSAAGRYTTVEAQLVWAGDDLIAVLAPAGDGSRKGWYLLLSDDACDVERVYFRTLEAARLWAETGSRWNGTRVNLRPHRPVKDFKSRK